MRLGLRKTVDDDDTLLSVERAQNHTTVIIPPPKPFTHIFGELSYYSFLLKKGDLSCFFFI